MGRCPWLLLLARTGVAPTISPASASVIASFNLPGTASPPWYLGAREIRTFEPCTQGFRRALSTRAERSGRLLRGGRRPCELAAGDPGNQVLLAEERDADRAGAGR